MTATKASHEAGEAMNRLCKWRSVLVGRLVGTQPNTPRIKGIRDIIDKLLISRVELNTLTQLLLEKEVFSVTEYQIELKRQAELLDKAHEQVFKGAHTTPLGIVIYDPEQWVKTTEGWPA